MMNVIVSLLMPVEDAERVSTVARLTVGPMTVLANDVAGADGFAAGGGVVGVRAAGVDLTTAVTVGVNTRSEERRVGIEFKYKLMIYVKIKIRFNKAKMSNILVCSVCVCKYT